MQNEDYWDTNKCKTSWKSGAIPAINGVRAKIVYNPSIYFYTQILRQNPFYFLRFSVAQAFFHAGGAVQRNQGRPLLADVRVR